jgi:TusA-related sulfurtransferase
MTSGMSSSDPADFAAGRPPHDLVLDERGSICPMPVIALARALKTAPLSTVLILADDPAASSDIPAWCSLQSRVLLWSGPAPDNVGLGFVIAPGQVSPAAERLVEGPETDQAD